MICRFTIAIITVVSTHGDNFQPEYVFTIVEYSEVSERFYESRSHFFLLQGSNMKYFKYKEPEIIRRLLCIAIKVQYSIFVFLRDQEHLYVPLVIYWDS